MVYGRDGDLTLVHPGASHGNRPSSVKTAGLLHHTDRGSTYTSEDYQSL